MASIGVGRRAVVGVVALAALTAGACSGDDGAGGSRDGATSTTTAATTSEADVRSSEDVLRVLVTNDDGVGAEGIDAVVEALRQLPDIAVTVVAPLENQSGTGGKFNDVPPVAAPATTASGFEATSVAGFPVDSVIHALDGGGMAERPHLVVSGINEGANLGPVVEVSGTIGAARAAVARGVPALAASQGIAEDPDFESGVRFVVDWVTEHRDELLAGTAPAVVESLNIPSCATGAIRGLVEVPTAPDVAGRDVSSSDCASSAAEPADDIDAFGNGYVSLSEVAVA